MIQLLVPIIIAVALAGATSVKRYVPDASLVDWGPDVESHEEFRFPFAAKYDDGRKRLFYVAGDHSSGMGPNLKTVKAMFDELKPQAVLVEGMTTEGDFAYRNWGVEDFAKDGFRGTSESPYAVWLASRRGLPVRGGEPSPRRTLREVRRRGYSEQDLLGFFTVRMVPGWTREGVVGDEAAFRVMASRELGDDRRRLGVKARFGYEELLAWYERMTPGVPLREVRYEHMGPEADGTRLQRLSFAVDQARQTRFNGQLENLLGRFDRVLVVFGGSHLCRERRMLERLLGPPTNVKPF